MADFPKKTLADWEKLAAKELRDKPLESLNWTTPEGIVVKPLYTAADLENLETAGALPGFAPFLRGPKATMYAGRPWTVRQYAGFSKASETNRLFKTMIQQGQTALSLAFDLVLSAPPAGPQDPAPPEYLAPHPSQWTPLERG